MRAMVFNVLAFGGSLALAAFVAYRQGDVWFYATHNRALLTQGTTLLVLGIVVSIVALTRSRWPIQKKEPAIMALTGIALGVAGVAWYALKVWNYSGRG